MSPARQKGKPVKAENTVPPGVDELSYEQALAELEKIVASLEANKPGEAGMLSLDEAMSLYERGQALTRHCVNLLDRAELRLKQLSGDALEDLPGDI